MSLHELVAYNTSVRDLTPIQGMPLKELRLSGCPVSDLSPLAGMALERLDITGTQVVDLRPLREVPLKVLSATRTKVSDLTPLAGMPLEELYLEDCGQITNLAPLAECRSLRLLTVPAQARGLEALRGLPALQSIYFSRPRAGWATNVAEFWRAYDARRK
jgi:Leucine-rich repeat (LRR) protein